MLHQSDRLCFIELQKKVLQLPSDERSFLKLEGMFLNVISFARLHGEDVEERQLLYNLKRIQKK